MKFSDKLSKILKANTLGIDTPSGLEEFIGASTGSITKPLKLESAPGPKIQKKIVEKLRINQDWWDTGKGEMFENGKSSSDDPVKILPMDAWELLEDDNRTFKKEINELWDMVRFLRGQSVRPHEGK